MSKLPKSTSSHAIGREARKQIPLFFNSEIWEHRENTGCDYGLDMIFEYIENEEVTGLKIDAQIKGSIKFKRLKNNDITFSLDIKTINYASKSRNPFLLLLYEISSKSAYYFNIKDNINFDIISKIEKNQSSYQIHIPQENKLKLENNDVLISIVKTGI